MGMTMTQDMADVLAARYLGFEGAGPAVAKLSDTQIAAAEADLTLMMLIEHDAEDGQLYATDGAWHRLSEAQDKGEVAR